MEQKRRFTIILEKDDGEFWGRIEYHPKTTNGFLHCTFGSSVEEVTKNLRDLIADSLAHELKGDTAFVGITAEDIEFDYVYD